MHINQTFINKNTEIATLKLLVTFILFEFKFFFFICTDCITLLFCFIFSLFDRMSIFKNEWTSEKSLTANFVLFWNLLHQPPFSWVEAILYSVSLYMEYFILPIIWPQNRLWTRQLHFRLLQQCCSLTWLGLSWEIHCL